MYLLSSLHLSLLDVHSRFLITWPFSQIQLKGLKKPAGFQLKKRAGLCVHINSDKLWRQHLGLESIDIFKIFTVLFLLLLLKR